MVSFVFVASFQMYVILALNSALTISGIATYTHILNNNTNANANANNHTTTTTTNNNNNINYYYYQQ